MRLYLSSSPLSSPLSFERLHQENNNAPSKLHDEALQKDFVRRRLVVDDHCRSCADIIIDPLSIRHGETNATMRKALTQLAL